MTQPTARGTAPVPPGPPRAQATAAVPTPPVMQARPLIALAGNTSLAAGEAVAAVGGAPAFIALAAVGAVAAVGTVASRTRAHRARRAADRHTRGPAAGGSGGGGGGLPRLFGGRSAGGGGRPNSGSGGRASGTSGAAGAARRPTTPGAAAGANHAGRPAAANSTGDSLGTGRKPPWRRRRDRAAGKSGGAYDPGVPEPRKRRRWGKRAQDGADVKRQTGKDKKTGQGHDRKPPARGAPGRPGSRIAPTVRVTDPTQTGQRRRPAPSPNPAPARSRRPATVTTAHQPPHTGGTPMSSGSASAMARILQIIEEDIRRVAAAYEPVGIEDVVREYELWPQALNALADVWRQMQATAEARYPLAKPVVDVVGAVDKHQRMTAAAAAEIGPIIRKVHRKQFEDLADSRNAMWDHRANPNTAAPPAVGKP